MSGITRVQALRSVLLVDDDDAQLRLYSRLLSDHLKSRLETSLSPTEALKLAERRLFDIVLIDVTMDYYGSAFGGLQFYLQLAGRYGSDSLIAYSKYITPELLNRFSYPFNFLEIRDDPVGFARQAAAKMFSLRKRQRCFVAMPFAKEYRPLWAAIKAASKAAFLNPVRIDMESFNASIHERIVRELREAKVVVVVTDSRNPNVFYEAGFAYALGKELITLTEEHSTLPFNVRDRNAIAYGGNLRTLKSRLTKRLREAR